MVTASDTATEVASIGSRHKAVDDNAKSRMVTDDGFDVSEKQPVAEEQPVAKDGQAHESTIGEADATVDATAEVNAESTSEENEAEYPVSWKLGLITIALALSVFCVALVRSFSLIRTLV